MKIYKKIFTDIYLGKLFNIPIFINSSCLLIFLIYAMTSIQFVGIYIFSFFVIILLHELGHCFAAKKLNVEVSSIQFFILGGMATIQFPEKAREDFLITIAGPLVNIALCPILILGSYFFEFFTELLILNIGLLLFNIFPMFPMDGGRIFRMILFHYNKNYFLSTLVAIRVGQFLAGCLILCGILFPNLVLVGAFVIFAAENEYRILKNKRLSCIDQSLKIMQKTQENLINFEQKKLS